MRVGEADDGGGNGVSRGDVTEVAVLCFPSCHACLENGNREAHVQ
jgi:hypothetical protein